MPDVRFGGGDKEGRKKRRFLSSAFIENCNLVSGKAKVEKKKKEGLSVKFIILMLWEI